MSRQLGVGFIGAGPVTQAIHMPVIASLGERLKVVHVMDVDRDVVEAVADRAGARASTDARCVLEDPEVDIVAICSPHRFHTDQLLAAVAAGKRAVLCEKPLATTAEQAERLTALCHRADVAVVVGAMHAYDPAWASALSYVLAYNARPELIRSTIYLPTNDVFVDLSTELVSGLGPLGATDGGTDVERQITAMRDSVLGLAIHDLPLVRQLYPSFDAVTYTRPLLPWGYMLVLSSPAQVAQMTAVMPGEWRPYWTFTASGLGYELKVDFPPSYVLAGSAVATVTDAGGTKVWRYHENGYQAEWRQLVDALDGRAALAFSIDDVVNDLNYALKVADGASRFLSAIGGGE